MTDILRMARQLYGPKLDDMMAEAGRIKEEYVAGGGLPEDVYSPERVQELKDAGPSALEQMPTQTRSDGSIAGPYVPADLAVAMNMIQRDALPAVLSALNDGVNTVSSGVDKDGVGFAIGRAPSGHVVKVRMRSKS